MLGDIILILSGKEVALKVREEVKKECAKFVALSSHKPTLAVVLVGDDPASATYVASKTKVCEELGFVHQDYKLEANIEEDVLLNLINQLNKDANVDAILVQLPLPSHMNERKIIKQIRAEKDVDGLHVTNLGSLLSEEEGFVPCTPAGILKILEYYNIETSGKNVTVVGRSNIVGKPTAALLMQKGNDATVTVCHSRTRNLKEATLNADILIAAIGKANFITDDMVNESCIVIDVGINRVDDDSRKKGYRLVGDVDFENVEKKCKAITPVPGGVGPMTIAQLMVNTLLAAQRHYNKRS